MIRVVHAAAHGTRLEASHGAAAKGSDVVVKAQIMMKLAVAGVTGIAVVRPNQPPHGVIARSKGHPLPTTDGHGRVQQRVAVDDGVPYVFVAQRRRHLCVDGTLGQPAPTRCHAALRLATKPPQAQLSTRPSHRAQLRQYGMRSTPGDELDATVVSKPPQSRGQVFVAALPRALRRKQSLLVMLAQAIG